MISFETAWIYKQRSTGSRQVSKSTLRRNPWTDQILCLVYSTKPPPSPNTSYDLYFEQMRLHILVISMLGSLCMDRCCLHVEKGHVEPPAHECRILQRSHRYQGFAVAQRIPAMTFRTRARSGRDLIATRYKRIALLPAAFFRVFASASMHRWVSMFAFPQLRHSWKLPRPLICSDRC